MSGLFSDTRPEAEKVLLDLLGKAPAWRKLEMVDHMNRAVRELALCGLRQRHPDMAPEEQRRWLADLLFGPELAAQVYGPVQAREVGHAT